MPKTIELDIIQGTTSLPMNISEGGRSFNLSPEELRVVEAVSPTVDAERTEDGVQITVHDLHGTKTVILNDGATGPAGPAGKDGKDGSNGKDGSDGRDGSDGTDGIDGATFTPTVSPEGVISWTNDGGRQNPQSVNIKGPQGDPGPGVPTVTAADNGKILRVVNGAWAAASLPSASGVTF